MPAMPAAPLLSATPTPSGNHLLLAFAAALDEGCQSLLPGLALPNLTRLLALAPTVTPEAPTHTDGELTLTPPHERAHAALLGLNAPDGQVPWAAWDTRSPQAAAWFTPCHQEVGNGHVTLHDPQALGLSEAHSRALLAALQPWAQEDGITLTWHANDRWLAQGAVFEGLATASLDRVVGRSIAPWLPMAPAAAPLRRLQNEAQMLFYTHPAHDERAAAGLAPVNAFWISGSGACATASVGEAVNVTTDTRLRTHGLRGDWAAWQQAWQQLDAEVLPTWLARAQAGEPVHLTLCGERGFTTLAWGTRSPWQRFATKISNAFGTQRFTSLLSSL
jgi:hypothetical protein